MPTLAKVLYRGLIGTVEETVYTVPAATTTIITGMVVCNNTALAATLTLSVVPDEGAADLPNRIMNTEEIDGRESTSLKYTLPMQTGDFISGLQGTENALTVTIYGVEITQ